MSGDELMRVLGALRAVRAELAATRSELRRAGGRTQPIEGSGRVAAVRPAFEERFRGSVDDVRARRAVYLAPTHAALTPGALDPRVLDLRPGRGDWLCLLREDGISAYGVDDDLAVVEHLRGQRLAAEHAEAAAHLAALPDGQLDVVTAFGFVAHLDLEDLLGLLAHVCRVLRPGGLLIAETPNPANLVSSARSLQLDPTGHSPLPAAQLRFLVEAGGFADVTTWELPPEEDVDLSGLRLDGVSAEHTAVLAATLQKGLFGPRDHAVLATTPTST